MAELVTTRQNRSVRHLALTLPALNRLEWPVNSSALGHHHIAGENETHFYRPFVDGIRDHVAPIGFPYWPNEKGSLTGALLIRSDRQGVIPSGPA
jgi:hypothetical protein